MNTLNAKVQHSKGMVHKWSGEQDSNPHGRWSDLYFSKCGQMAFSMQLVTEIPENSRYCKRCFKDKKSA